jgi:pyruvate dehydrogenase E2 component (dihydrolipoamide acetyltransferase)
MLPLALSYDHRVIDGADGARFIRSLVDALENFKEEDVKIS